MKRIITVLAVAALMAVMMVAMAAPAFARISGTGAEKYCEHSQGRFHGAQGGPILCGEVIIP
jgi:type II secretory pathway component PulK